MRIALDAMGGDYAPQETVLGAVQVASSPDFDHEIVLVGDESRIRSLLRSHNAEAIPNLSVLHASEVVEMHEHPTHAIRKKRDSSLVVCGQLVKSGEADATLSAGNTGAAMAIGVLDIGRIPGIERPAIAAPLPTTRGVSLLVDAGANVDCSPQNLVQFAIMGAIFAERALGKIKPVVGLLSVGAEPSKGDEVTKAAHLLLQSAPIEFHGNVEGKDVWDHPTDVIVCDGFAGNVLLKTAEGFAEWVVRMIYEEAKTGSQEEQRVIHSLLSRLFDRIDYAEHGSAPLLGINAVSMISHGRSKAKAVASGLRMAIAAAESGFVQAIRDGLQAV
jgi:glycerol-3-phosphate acyltransferase PlsX